MKKHLAIILSIILFGCGVEKSNAQASIRLIEISHYDVKETSDGIVKGEQILEFPYGSSVEEFNREGEIIESTQTNESYSGVTRYRSAYSYDTLGFLIEEKIIKNGEIEFIKRFKYDSTGHLISEEILEKDTMIRLNIFNYDNNGNQISACYIRLGDSVCENRRCSIREEYSYNDKGLRKELKYIECDDIRIEKYKYNEIDSLISVTNIVKNEIIGFKEYEYDEMGNRIKMNVSDREIHTYDSLGNQLTFKQFDENGHLHIEELTDYIYEDKTRIEKWQQLDGKGKILGESVTLFDQYGNLVKKQSSIDTGYRKIKSLYVYEYQYDEKGNWVTKIEFIDEKPRLLTERKIHYY